MGTKLDDFDENANATPILKKPENEIWLGYCGSLAASYNIPLVIDALKIISDRGLTPPKFIVMGGGARKDEFENYAKSKDVDVCFVGKLPYADMCSLVSECDIVVNPIVKGSAASIINKHADYASSGLPVLNTQESVEYRNLVDEYEMGFNCKNEDPMDLADKLAILLADEQLRKKMGANARKCAEEKFDRKNTYKKIYEIIEDSSESSINYS